MDIPIEHQMKCITCGELIDMRDLPQVLSHGWKNENTGVFECKPVTAEYSSSKKIGQPVEYTKDKSVIPLN